MQLHPGWTVNETLRAIPRAASVLNRLGIDTCCGGSLTLEEAGRAAGSTPEQVIAEIRNADEETA